MARVRYIIGVLIPLLLQSLFVFVVIAMNTGNGSWVGLGALLLGMFAIPITALTNLLYIRARRTLNPLPVLVPCFLMALIVPFILLLLLIIG